MATAYSSFDGVLTPGRASGHSPADVWKREKPWWPRWSESFGRKLA